MSPFRQLPVWSPLTLGALGSGVRAAWLGGAGQARAELDRHLRGAYLPQELYLTDSGTSALTLALQAAAEFTRAPVALPAYCCFDVATAADGAGTPFFLYDVDPATLSPDPASLREVLAAGARTVVVAHLFGVPADLESVQRLAAEYGALVVEDAAQGSGCEWKGRPAGAHGALGILSFGRGKGVTGGKGGALLVNDDRLLDGVASAWAAARGARAPRGTVRDFLALVAQWAFGRPSLYWIPAGLPFLRLGETIYRPPRQVGGISTLAAGVLGRTIPLSGDSLPGRRERAALLASRLGGLAASAPGQGWTEAWLRFPVVLQRTAVEVLTPYHMRDGVLRGYPETLRNLEGFGSRALNAEAAFPGARQLADRLVTIPTHRFVRGARVPAF